MRAKSEYRDRPTAEVEVLDALVDRGQDGMTVFELRAAVESDIDSIEAALSSLKDDHLISVEAVGGRTVIKPAERVIPDEPQPESVSIVEWLRERLQL